MRGTLIKAILIYIRLHPGVKGSEVQVVFKDSPKNAISGSIARLRRAGLVENRGPSNRWSEWYPVEVEPVDPEFLEIAQELLEVLSTVLKSEREEFLARKLKEIFPR
jgi:hypothetical protein